MIVEVQLHGYRKGHQLLASSILLSKEDQAVVDRLSDVAGPLRPKELFAPYLTAYPLPSGTYYVIARTWQDLTVPRAGCVRTKSVLIDVDVWSLSPPITPILRLLDSVKLPTETDAVRSELTGQLQECFPRAINFSASELLEALFLEEVKPVVMFDAPDPELISLRLITALWPEIRRRFAVSTFALSPRKIGSRDFDLVFAPLNAKNKFSDWPGRRVDGRSSQINRHRWTGGIVQRVFEDPVPRLLSDHEVDLLNQSESDSAVALRIALLWDELLSKLEKTPTAVLGLLDIANSGMVNTLVAVQSLEPRLAEAMRDAAVNLPSNDAWDFFGATVRKIHEYRMPAVRAAVEQLASHLAEHYPEGLIGLLIQPDPKGAIDGLIPYLAIGLGKGAMPQVENVLVNVPTELLVRLISEGDELVSRVANYDALINKVGSALVEVDPALAEKAGKKLLPFLVEDRHFPAASPIFTQLDAKGIALELNRLANSNNFQSRKLSTALLNRARYIGALDAAREVLISLSHSKARDDLLMLAIEPVELDVKWILGEQRLNKTTSVALLENVLRRADDMQFGMLLANTEIGERIITRLPHDAVDLLERAILQDCLPINAQNDAFRSIIPLIDDARKFNIAQRSIARCLRSKSDTAGTAVLSSLITILGTRLDGRWIVRIGLERGVEAEVASRNLIVFETAPLPARKRIVEAVDEMARAMHGRLVVDLSEVANDACAKLMFEAEKNAPKALIDAAGWLMPLLLRSRSQPVSLLIAALFPIIYRELAKAEDVPELLKFVPFFDWDRCKAARHEIVEAFMMSTWRAGDLALTAFRCGDLEKILKRVARSYGGEEYLMRMENDLGHLDRRCRSYVKNTIARIRADIA